MTTQNTELVGRNLRSVIYDLLRESEKLTGEKPHLVVYATGEPGIIWWHRQPTLEEATRLSVNESPVVQVLPIGLRGLTGLLQGIVPVTSG